MPISHSAKIIFVHIPKTGGGTIEKTLGIYGKDNNGNLSPDHSLLYGKYKINDTEIDSDTFNNHLESGKRPPQTSNYASFGGYVEDFVESCQFTNFDGSPFLTLKLKETK